MAAEPLIEVSGRAQFVTHDCEELGPHPLEFLERREILHRDHDRLHAAVRCMDRRGVEQRLDAPAVGHREHHLLVAKRLPAAQVPGHRELGQRNLAPVRAPERDYLRQTLYGAIRHPQALDDPFRLAVEGHDTAGPGVKDHHADRRGVHQGLQAGPGPLLVPIGPRVGDGRRRLRSEEHEHLLVPVGELASVSLLAEKEAADMHAPVMDRRALQGMVGHHARADPQRPEIPPQVSEPQRARMLDEVAEQPRPVAPSRQSPVLVPRDAGA